MLIGKDPLTRGYRSQFKRIYGSLNCAWQQRKAFDFEGTKEDLKYFFKIMAIEDGYPYKVFKREVIPKSIADLTIEEATILITTITEFCDRNNLWIYEYNHIRCVYKSIGGRTQLEMMRDFPGVN
jgi:hypothetical protein